MASTAFAGNAFSIIAGSHSCCWMGLKQQSWPLQLLLELAWIDRQHLTSMHHAAPPSTQPSLCMLT